MTPAPELLHCLSLISHFVDMTPEEVLSKQRTAYHVFVRQCIMKILHKQGYGYQFIANLLGYKSHASVLHLVKYYSAPFDYKYEAKLLEKVLESCETIDSISMKIDRLQQQIEELKRLRDGLKLRVA